MTMSANLKVFSDVVEDVQNENVAQMVDAFNAASRGTIVMTTKATRGDYDKSLIYTQIASLIGERDIDSEASVSAVDIVRAITGGVKIARRVGPVNLNPHIYDWINRSPQEAGIVVGQQFAQQKMQDMLNTALAAFVPATLNVGSTLVNDTSAVPTLSGMSDAAAKFGDGREKIRAWVMHSSTYNLLYKAGLTNSANLFVFGNVAIKQDPFGNPWIVTDSTSLVNSADYYCCGLVAGGIRIDDQGDYRSVTVDSTGQQNIRQTYQGEYSWKLTLLGYNYDETNGGANPDNATLATGTNWDKSATSVKDMAGVVYTSHLS